MVQVVWEDSQNRHQVRARDEADPFARLHPGRRLFLPSLSPEGADCTNGQSTLRVLVTLPAWLQEEGSNVLWLPILRVWDLLALLMLVAYVSNSPHCAKP